MRSDAKKCLESRMLGNLHVRFGVGVRVQSPGLHHVRVEPRSNNAIAAGLSSFQGTYERPLEWMPSFQLCSDMGPQPLPLPPNVPGNPFVINAVTRKRNRRAASAAKPPAAVDRKVNTNKTMMISDQSVAKVWWHGDGAG